MPELPEAETQRRDLADSGIIGQRIESVQVLWPKTLVCEDMHSIEGLQITDIGRRGKYLVFNLSHSLYVLAHLRMSGAFEVRSRNAEFQAHDRVVCFLGDKQLVFRDVRKFGRLYVSPSVEALCSHLGDEPFDPELDAKSFFNLLHAHNRMIKALLLDQHVIAGLGNIYTDEALFLAGIHPTTKSKQLTAEQAARLLEAIRQVLNEGISHRGTSLGAGKANFKSAGSPGTHASYLRVFGRSGKLCPVCSSSIEKTVVSQRTSSYCPVCQPIHNF
jgi:formamidopyrimidine-DNA glycosylase